MRNVFCPHLLIVILAFQFSCKGEPQEATPQDESPKALVKTALVTRGDIEETIRFNGKSVYLRKNFIASPIGGYLTKVLVQPGDMVKKGDILFEVQTKENKALSESGLSENLTLGAGGKVRIPTPSDGVIGDLSAISSGTYVPEGSQLCTVVEDKEMLIQLNIPFENHSLIKKNNTCTVHFPDGTIHNGSICKILPVMNETSQTQAVLIQLQKAVQIPENLNVTVRFVKTRHRQSLLVPTNAVLTDEMQSAFWVMKVVHDSIAVQIPVTKGIANETVTEVSSPGLSLNDIVITEGSYGLPDSTVVQSVQ